MEQTSSKFLVPGAIVVAGALVALAIYAGGGKAPSVANQPQAAEDLPAVTSKDHILGDPNAEVIIVEYSDTECPFCKIFHNTLKEIMNEYDGEVAWVYRHFPIPQLHAKAMNEAEATECAAELGGNEIFWSYLHRLFDLTESNDSLDPAELPRIAASLGLDVGAFNTCLSSNRHEEKIKDSIEEAVRIGARGTPYSALVARDGREVVVNGAEPIEMVRRKIDALLK